MTPTKARESRRKAIEGITSALWTMSQDGSYLRSIAACEAMAQAHQLLGRLWAIDEQEAYTEAIANGQPARSPKPSIIPDVDDLPSRPACAAPHCLKTAESPSVYCKAHQTIPGYPEPEITLEMETASARRMARQTEPSMPDDVLEAMAEAWDRDDNDAVQAIVAKLKLNGRGA